MTFQGTLKFVAQENTILFTVSHSLTQPLRVFHTTTESSYGGGGGVE